MTFADSSESRFLRSPLSIVSAPWDGSQLYVGGGSVTINGASCHSSLDALNPATGAFVWRTCVAGHLTAGITEVPGCLSRGSPWMEKWCS